MEQTVDSALGAAPGTLQSGEHIKRTSGEKTADRGVEGPINDNSRKDGKEDDEPLLQSQKALRIEPT